ncbi:hypothetical protein D3C73_703110 [compost metagenome]
MSDLPNFLDLQRLQFLNALLNRILYTRFDFACDGNDRFNIHLAIVDKVIRLLWRSLPSNYLEDQSLQVIKIVRPLSSIILITPGLLLDKFHIQNFATLTNRFVQVHILPAGKGNKILACTIRKTVSIC